MRAKPSAESSAAGCIVEEFSLLIAQLSDLHVNQPGDPIGGGNRERLEEALDTILDFARKPDLIVDTGDIAEQGNIESYRMFIDVMTQATLPWTATLGNHDSTEAFFASLAEAPECGFRAGRVHIFEDWALVLADTSAAPHHGGWFDEGRAAQLARNLASTVHCSAELARSVPARPRAPGRTPAHHRRSACLCIAPRLRWNSNHCIWNGSHGRSLARLWRGSVKGTDFVRPGGRPKKDDR